MLETVIKMTLLLSLALLAAACLPRTRPAPRHSVLLGALLLLPLVPASVLLPPLLAVRLELPATDSPPLIENHLSKRPSSLLLEPERPQRSGELPLAPVALSLYLMVASGLILRQLADHRALKRLLNTGTPSSLAAPYSVLTTPEPTVPLACGVRHPMILLPESALAWEEEHLSAVLLHESAHLHRRDPLWQALTELIRALFWFHPLVWLVVVRLRLEAESACDRHVLASGIAPDRYAHYLLEIVKMLKNRPNAPAMAHTPRLEGRVRSILAYLPTRPVRGVGAALALLGLASVPLLAARPVPQQKEQPKAQAKPPLVVVAKPSAAAKEQGKMPEEKGKPKELVAKEVKQKRLDTANAQAKKVERVQELAKVARLNEAKARQLDEEAKMRLRADQERAQKRAELEARNQELAEVARRRQQVIEPLQEELEELKIKLRDLDSRLTDKKLELAALDREKINALERSGLDVKGKELLQGLEKQIEVLENMIAVTQKKREEVRFKMYDLSGR